MLETARGLSRAEVIAVLDHLRDNSAFELQNRAVYERALDDHRGGNVTSPTRRRRQSPFPPWTAPQSARASQSGVTVASVTYELADGIATVRIDDGKRNALSPDVFRELNAALDRAEADRAAVILTGREQVFSAGFDLKVMKSGGPNALRMLALGYSMTARLLAFPYPVVVACNGHVLAMGVFLMLSADYVIGTRGDFKVSANEVAIGLTMPRVAAMLLGHRLTPAAWQRAVTLSEYFSVDSAREAGFFDELVESSQLMDRARARAGEFLKLDLRAHAASKRRIRRKLIRRIRCSIPLDLFDAVLMGLRGARPSAPR